MTIDEAVAFVRELAASEYSAYEAVFTNRDHRGTVNITRDLARFFAEGAAPPNPMMERPRKAKDDWFEDNEERFTNYGPREIYAASLHPDGVLVYVSSPSLGNRGLTRRWLVASTESGPRIVGDDAPADLSEGAAWQHRGGRQAPKGPSIEVRKLQRPERDIAAWDAL